MPALLASRSVDVDSAAYLAQDRAASIVSLVGVFWFIALVTVILRLYVRRFMLHYLGADDVFIILAMICGIGVFSCFASEIKYGEGRHIKALSQHEIAVMAHFNFVHQLINTLGTALAKISICLLLIRLVKHRRFVYFLWSLLGFFAVCTIASVLANILACLPIDSIWAESAVTGGDSLASTGQKCISHTAFVDLGIASSAVNIATDLLLAILPIPVVLGMTLNKRTKIALCFVLCLGFLAVGAGAVKIHAQFSLISNEDPYYHDHFRTWAAIELYFGIIAASLPTIRPLLSAFLNSARSTIKSSDHAHRLQTLPKLPTKKHSRGTDSILSTKSMSGCSSEALSPSTSPEEGTSYIAYLSQSNNDFITDCSRADSIGISLPSAKSASKDAIVRTRQVTTVSEPIDIDMPEHPRPVKQLSRSSSRESALPLKDFRASL